MVLFTVVIVIAANTKLLGAQVATMLGIFLRVWEIVLTYIIHKSMASIPRNHTCEQITQSTGRINN